MIVLYVCIILFLALVCIAISSRYRIRAIYRKYLKVANHSDLSGKQLAAVSIDYLNLPNLHLAVTDGELTDAYSPKHQTLIMSREVCDSASLASITIVAHELGHAVQHKNGNPLFTLCNILAKLTIFTSKFIIPLLVVGFLMYMFKIYADIALILLYTSLGLFLLQLLQKVLTIPLEYGASKIALKYLKDYNFLSRGEMRQAKRLLRVAAQTYIASLFDGFFIAGNKLKRIFTKN